MKELNTFKGNGTIKQLLKEVLLNTNGQYIKESNILAGNATIVLHQMRILLNTNRQYMKESNTPANNVAKNFLFREMF